jgi:hypothetical protein
MPKYTFDIKKGDHFPLNSNPDLHIHVYYNQGQGKRLMGRYRLPDLSPIFPFEPKLNQTEIKAIKEWLTHPDILKKLNLYLKDTCFDIHKLAKFGEVRADKEGETYIEIKIPVTRRLGALN